MIHLIDKDALVAKIEELDNFWHLSKSASGLAFVEKLLSSLDTLEATGKQWKSYGCYSFDTPIEVCQCLANLGDEKLINIVYSNKYIVFYAKTFNR